MSANTNQGAETMAYKYANPYEWLEAKSQEWNKEQLRAALLSLAINTDSDMIEDQYQDDMEADGYFEEIDT